MRPMDLGKLLLTVFPIVTGLLLGGTAHTATASSCESLFALDTTETSIVGLSSTFAPSDRALAQKYLDQVPNQYARLPKFSKLSAEARKAALQLTPEFIDRSAVIVTTTDHKRGLLGGIMIVYSHSSNERLPFQNSEAFKDFQRPSDEGSAVEIGRLTTLDEIPARGLERGRELILRSLRQVSRDPTITHVYVHTSAVHARLYRMMGFRPESIIKYDDLNYLIRYTRAEVERHLR